MFRILLLIAALIGVISNAQAASFDCAKAGKPDVVAICATAELSALDSEMDGLWFAFSKVPMLMGSNGARMDDAHDFLNKRTACAGDVSCLRQTYHARIEVLKQSIAREVDNYFQLQNADPATAPCL